MVDNLLKEISSDLNISSYKNEVDSSYRNRVIYSALVAWGRVQVLGKSYTDIYDIENDYHDVDINHIQSKLTKVSYGLLYRLVRDNKWIKNIELDKAFSQIASEIASEIIEKLTFCYEISELIYKRRRILSPERRALFKKHTLVLGGSIWKDGGMQSVGIGRWESNLSKLCNYKEVFNIPESTKEEYYNSIMDNASWTKYELENTYDIFKANKKERLSKRWVDFDKSNIPNGISLLRNNKTERGYFLIKKDENDILCTKLDEWYKNEYELYRIMYILSWKNKSPIVFEAKNNDDHILLHCNSRLPNPETRILLMSSWPLEEYDNIFKRIIPKFLWEDLLDCFINLGININFTDKI